MKKSASSTRFVHVSLRIPVGVRDQLVYDAQHHNITLNSLLNGILSKYLAYDKIVQGSGAIPLGAAFFREILEGASTDQLEAIARKLGEGIVRKSFSFQGIDFNLDNLIEFYFEPLSAHSGWYLFNTRNIQSLSGSRRLIFAHSHGPKWTAFLRRYLATIIRSASGREPEVSIEDDVLIFTCS